jgi:hypothetical protein
MSWRDAVPHAGAGLGRGLEYRPRLSAGLLIQQSNCNAGQARWTARAGFREARRPAYPRPAKPMSIITQVEDSGAVTS